MENANGNTPDFVREQIKDKPKNRKKLYGKLGTSALCGATFGIAACLVVLIMRPFLWNDGAVPLSGTEKVQTQARATESDEKTTESTEMDAETEMISGTSQKDLEHTGEGKEPEKSVRRVTLEDYQHLQSELYAIGSQANRSIVSVTGVVSDTDWFNTAYEREGQGCGTIIQETKKKYLILTEYKIVKGASQIRVTFEDDAVAAAKLVRYDGNTGMAIVSVNKSELDDRTRARVCAIKTGKFTTLRQGTMVIALGSPLGTNYSILTGTITSSNNEISTLDNNYSVLTTDIVANKNGSGILINTEGELLGVVMQEYSAGSTSTLSAVALSELKPVLDMLCENKGIPYIGLSVSTVTEHIAERYDLPKGVYIKEVRVDSPAMDAGLQSGDVIVKVDDTAVLSDNNYSNAVLALSTEKECTITIMRQGSDGYTELTYQVMPGVLK